jgi:hypothetical protein
MRTHSSPLELDDVVFDKAAGRIAILAATCVEKDIDVSTREHTPDPRALLLIAFAYPFVLLAAVILFTSGGLLWAMGVGLPAALVFFTLRELSGSVDGERRKPQVGRSDIESVGSGIKKEGGGFAPLSSGELPPRSWPLADADAA